MSFPPDSADAPDPASQGGTAGAAPPRSERRGGFRRPLGAAALGIALVAGGATAVAVAQGSAPSTLPALGEGPVREAAPETSTTSTVALPATAVAEAAPAPPDPAGPPAAAGELVRIGEIHIPKIGLVHPIYEGVELRVVDHGPGHWPGSALPGELGNAVFAGHRVTHSHPFRRLHELGPGDEITFRMPDGEYTYGMTRQEIVFPDDTWIVDPTDDATVTLFACHPPGSARQRIVVRGSFRRSSPLPAGSAPLG